MNVQVIKCDWKLVKMPIQITTTYTVDYNNPHDSCIKRFDAPLNPLHEARRLWLYAVITPECDLTPAYENGFCQSLVLYNEQSAHCDLQ